MITLVKTPPLVAHTGNPIRFSVYSENTVEVEAVISQFVIVFVNAAQEDDLIRIAWGSVDLTFTFKETPDHSGLQLPCNYISADLSDWITEVVTALLVNYFLSRDWSIQGNSDSIVFTGKVPEAVSPIVEFTWPVSGAGTLASLTDGTSLITRPFYKIGLRVLVNVAGNWQLIGEDVLPVNLSAVAEFDIHTLFADYVYPEFLWPEISIDLMPLRPKSTIEYCVEYYEQYGNPIVPGIITHSGSFYALFGGVSKSQEAVYHRNGSSFWHKLTYNNYFLTWQPKSKVVALHQVEKLFFFIQKEMTHVSLRISYYMLDGTSLLNQALSSVDHPPDKGVVEITVSPWHVRRGGDYIVTVDSYDVWIEYQSERISEIRTFKIDRTYYENQRYFLFLNSIGGYDTLRVTGDQEDTLEYTRTDIDKTLPAFFEDINHESATGYVRETITYKANTGWITREQLSWLREFFLSKQVYQIKGDKLMAVVVFSSKVLQRTDKEFMYALEFEYRRSYESEFYSREITYQTFGDDFENDYPNE